MRKELVFALAMAGALLAGCGGSNGSDNTAESATEAEIDGLAAGADTDLKRSIARLNEMMGISPTEEDTEAEEEEVEYPDPIIIQKDDETFDVDGVTVSFADVDTESIQESKHGEEVIAKTKDGAYRIVRSPRTEAPYMLKKTAETDEANTIKAAGGTWTISEKEGSWSLYDYSSSYGEDEPMYSSDNGDIMVTATNVYTDSEGNIARRYISYATHDGNARAAVEQMVISLTETAAE